MPTDWIDFKEMTKDARAIDDVLSRYGIELRTVGPDCRRGRCPLPTHSFAGQLRQLLR